MAKTSVDNDLLKCQPDAVEIEQQSVGGGIRWVLYLILITIVLAVVWACVFKVDRIVSAEGVLLTTSPTVVVQPLQTATIRTIEIEVGDIVEQGQLLATLDSTFTAADLSQLQKQQTALGVQLRRIDAELSHQFFSAAAEEGEDGVLQEQLYVQRNIIFQRNKLLNQEKVAALQAKLALNKVQRHGKQEQIKLIRDVEGTTARNPNKDNDYRLKLLDVQKSRLLVESDVQSLLAEEQVVLHELKQAESEWQRFVEERSGDLMEQKVKYRMELEKITEEINKAKRLQDLVSLRAPEKGIVLDLAKRSVGSIVQQAEPFITLVPQNSDIEVEVNVQSKDIARIRTGDRVRVKLDAFPFQRHGTLPGEVRVISEDSFQFQGTQSREKEESGSKETGGYYRTRVKILSSLLQHVPDGFRLMPGMTVKAEIKIGRRSIISYFLYPVIRVFDESLREP